MIDTLCNNYLEQVLSPPQRGKRSGYWIRRIQILLAVLGASYQAIAERVDARSYPPPVGEYKMHINFIREGSPTVILDGANSGTVSN